MRNDRGVAIMTSMEFEVKLTKIILLDSKEGVFKHLTLALEVLKLLGLRNSTTERRI